MFLHEKVLFGYLKISQKRFYDTIPFCKTLKDYDGTMISTSEQRDVNEFFSLLFDRLESEGSSAAKLLKASFGGTLLHEIVSRDCEHRSRRLEPFFMISVDVQGCFSLEKGLEAFVTGEMLDGDDKYLCMRCKSGESQENGENKTEGDEKDMGRKVTALKRCSLGTLPKILIIHLKRFEFDFDTMTKRKLNDYCSFPNTLDVKSYTATWINKRERKDHELQSQANSSDRQNHNSDELHKDPEYELDQSMSDHMDTSDSTQEPKSSEFERSDEEQEDPELLDALNGGLKATKYVLRGVLIHTGMADSGHYYSFIRLPVQDDDAPNANSSKRWRWYEFNDSTVTPFSEALLAEECFGGVEVVERWSNAQGKYVKVETSRINNAYMLFYERVDQSELAIERPLHFDPNDHKENEPTTKEVSDSKHVEIVRHASFADPQETHKDEQELANPEQISRDLHSVDPLEPLQHKEALILLRRKSSESYPLPPSILEAVWSENVGFLNELNLFHPSTRAFVWALAVTALQQHEGSEIGAGAFNLAQNGCAVAGELSSQYLSMVVAQSRGGRQSVQSWSCLISCILGQSSAAAKWLLYSSATFRGAVWTTRILLQCPHSDIREEVSNILLEAFR